MKNVHRVSTKQRGHMKSGVSRSRNSTFSQARCASALFCLNMWKFNYPYKHVNAIALRIFGGCNWKTSKNLSSVSQIFHYRSKVATDSTSLDLQACTRNT